MSTTKSPLAQITGIERKLKPVAGIEPEKVPPDSATFGGFAEDVDSDAKQPRFANIVSTLPLQSNQRLTISFGASFEALVDGAGLTGGEFDLRRMGDGFSIKATFKF